MKCGHCLLYAWKALEHARKCEKNPVYSLEAMSKAQNSLEHSGSWR